jgi:LmbE family N-acetylglucosaminyl deacetylase
MSGSNLNLILVLLFTLMQAAGNARSEQFLLLTQDMVWDVKGSDRCHDQSGPENWLTPVNYVEGSLYLRLTVKSKPTSKQVFVQICVFQDGWKIENCSDGLTFTDEGVYYLKLQRKPVDFWKKDGNSLDFSRRFSHVCFAVKDRDSEGRLMQYTSCGAACYEGDDLQQHMPIAVQAEIWLVSKGSEFSPPEEWLGFSGFEYEPQPEKTALMIVAAHPDDEVYNFGGAITHYHVLRQLPVTLICMTSQPEIREQELRCACWTYGLRTEPIFARFANCCYGGSVADNWQQWGGKEKVVEYLTMQIRQYKPDVLLGHDLKGELRGHPNHICSALALIDAVQAAADSTMFTGQLDSLDLWQAKKLYLHFYPKDSWSHSWTEKSPGLQGKQVREVADAGIRWHVSQKATSGCKEADEFGLFYSTVGPDTGKEDFFENIDVSIYK